ncbi:hypothetical protein HELRODRAFT_191501 [Helobdella robusta]|uniref:Uncharacterized protein n=1 Tax=Helobdella robusta TaxID=6412 RepID=T1FT17_HELRO|nr:hypothetical protein HELRODRAFT_191501 [Helobdella robusta]ESO04889.1 hypothetical protein HELRODRAFT_191501 [Helobdella robusta]
MSSMNPEQLTSVTKLSPQTNKTVSEKTDFDSIIQIELDKLNNSSYDVNNLELELVKEKGINLRIQEECKELDKTYSKLKCHIAKAKPYYDAHKLFLQAKVTTQIAQSKYDQACCQLAAAKEMAVVAEHRFFETGQPFNDVWQEMLNHTMQKMDNAEKNVFETDVLYRMALAFQKEVEQSVKKLQKDCKKSISKSMPYYQMKAVHVQMLEEQKKKISQIEASLAETKKFYSDTLKNLEVLSEKIRKCNNQADQSSDSLSVMSIETIRRDDTKNQTSKNEISKKDISKNGISKNGNSLNENRQQVLEKTKIIMHPLMPDDELTGKTLENNSTYFIGVPFNGDAVKEKIAGVVCIAKKDKEDQLKQLQRVRSPHGGRGQQRTKSSQNYLQSLISEVKKPKNLKLPQRQQLQNPTMHQQQDEQLFTQNQQCQLSNKQQKLLQEEQLQQREEAEKGRTQLLKQIQQLQQRQQQLQQQLPLEEQQDFQQYQQDQEKDEDKKCLIQLPHTRERQQLFDEQQHQQLSLKYQQQQETHEQSQEKCDKLQLPEKRQQNEQKQFFQILQQNEPEHQNENDREQTLHEIQNIQMQLQQQVDDLLRNQLFQQNINSQLNEHDVKLEVRDSLQQIEPIIQQFRQQSSQSMSLTNSAENLSNLTFVPSVESCFKLDKFFVNLKLPEQLKSSSSKLFKQSFPIFLSVHSEAQVPIRSSVSNSDSAKMNALVASNQQPPSNKLDSKYCEDFLKSDHSGSFRAPILLSILSSPITVSSTLNSLIKTSMKMFPGRYIYSDNLNVDRVGTFHQTTKEFSRKVVDDNNEEQVNTTAITTTLVKKSPFAFPIVEKKIEVSQGSLDLHKNNLLEACQYKISTVSSPSIAESTEMEKVTPTKKKSEAVNVLQQTTGDEPGEFNTLFSSSLPSTTNMQTIVTQTLPSQINFSSLQNTKTSTTSPSCKSSLPNKQSPSTLTFVKYLHRNQNLLYLLRQMIRFMEPDEVGVSQPVEANVPTCKTTSPTELKKSSKNKVTPTAFRPSELSLLSLPSQMPHWTEKYFSQSNFFFQHASRHISTETQTDDLSNSSFESSQNKTQMKPSKFIDFVKSKSLNDSDRDTLKNRFISTSTFRYEFLPSKESLLKSNLSSKKNVSKSFSRPKTKRVGIVQQSARLSSKKDSSHFLRPSCCKKISQLSSAASLTDEKNLMLLGNLNLLSQLQYERFQEEQRRLQDMFYDEQQEKMIAEQYLFENQFEVQQFILDQQLQLQQQLQHPRTFHKNNQLRVLGSEQKSADDDCYSLMFKKKGQLKHVDKQQQLERKPDVTYQRPLSAPKFVSFNEGKDQVAIIPKEIIVSSTTAASGTSCTLSPQVDDLNVASSTVFLPVKPGEKFQVSDRLFPKNNRGSEISIDTKTLILEDLKNKTHISSSKETSTLISSRDIVENQTNNMSSTKNSSETLATTEKNKTAQNSIKVGERSGGIIYLAQQTSELSSKSPVSSRSASPSDSTTSSNLKFSRSLSSSSSSSAKNDYSKNVPTSDIFSFNRRTIYMGTGTRDDNNNNEDLSEATNEKSFRKFLKDKKLRMNNFTSRFNKTENLTENKKMTVRLCPVDDCDRKDESLRRKNWRITPYKNFTSTKTRISSRSDWHGHVSRDRTLSHCEHQKVPQEEILMTEMLVNASKEKRWVDKLFENYFLHLAENLKNRTSQQQIKLDCCSTCVSKLASMENIEAEKVFVEKNIDEITGKIQGSDLFHKKDVTKQILNRLSSDEHGTTKKCNEMTSSSTSTKHNVESNEKKYLKEDVNINAAQLNELLLFSAAAKEHGFSNLSIRQHELSSFRSENKQLSNSNKELTAEQQNVEPSKRSSVNDQRIALDCTRTALPPAKLTDDSTGLKCICDKTEEMACANKHKRKKLRKSICRKNCLNVQRQWKIKKRKRILKPRMTFFEKQLLELFKNKISKMFLEESTKETAISTASQNSKEQQQTQSTLKPREPQQTTCLPSQQTTVSSLEQQKLDFQPMEPEQPTTLQLQQQTTTLQQQATTSPQQHQQLTTLQQQQQPISQQIKQLTISLSQQQQQQQTSQKIEFQQLLFKQLIHHPELFQKHQPLNQKSSVNQICENMIVVNSNFQQKLNNFVDRVSVGQQPVDHMIQQKDVASNLVKVNANSAVKIEEWKLIPSSFTYSSASGETLNFSKFSRNDSKKKRKMLESSRTSFQSCVRGRRPIPKIFDVKYFCGNEEKIKEKRKKISPKSKHCRKAFVTFVNFDGDQNKHKIDWQWELSSSYSSDLTNKRTKPKISKAAKFNRKNLINEREKMKITDFKKWNDMNNENDLLPESLNSVKLTSARKNASIFLFRNAVPSQFKRQMPQKTILENKTTKTKLERKTPDDDQQHDTDEQVRNVPALKESCDTDSFRSGSTNKTGKYSHSEPDVSSSVDLNKSSDVVSGGSKSDKQSVCESKSGSNMDHSDDKSSATDHSRSNENNLSLKPTKKRLKSADVEIPLLPWLGGGNYYYNKTSSVKKQIRSVKTKQTKHLANDFLEKHLPKLTEKFKIHNLKQNQKIKFEYGIENFSNHSIPDKHKLKKKSDDDNNDNNDSLSTSDDSIKSRSIFHSIFSNTNIDVTFKSLNGSGTNVSNANHSLDLIEDPGQNTTVEEKFIRDKSTEEEIQNSTLLKIYQVLQRQHKKLKQQQKFIRNLEEYSLYGKLRSKCHILQMNQRIKNHSSFHFNAWTGFGRSLVDKNEKIFRTNKPKHKKSHKTSIKKQHKRDLQKYNFSLSSKLKSFKRMKSKRLSKGSAVETAAVTTTPKRTQFLTVKLQKPEQCGEQQPAGQQFESQQLTKLLNESQHETISQQTEWQQLTSQPDKLLQQQQQLAKHYSLVQIHENTAAVNPTFYQGLQYPADPVQSKKKHEADNKAPVEFYLFTSDVSNDQSDEQKFTEPACRKQTAMPSFIQPKCVNESPIENSSASSWTAPTAHSTIPSLAAHVARQRQKSFKSRFCTKFSGILLVALKSYKRKLRKRKKIGWKSTSLKPSKLKDSKNVLIKKARKRKLVTIRSAKSICCGESLAANVDVKTPGRTNVVKNDAEGAISSCGIDKSTTDAINHPDIEKEENKLKLRKTFEYQRHVDYSFSI